MFLSLSLNWVDFSPWSLLSNSPLSKALDARKIGWLNSVLYWSIIISAVLSQFSVRFIRTVLVRFLFWSKSKEWPMTARKPASILRNVIRILNTFLCVSVFSPHNVLEHWHEDDSAVEVLKFTLYTFHEFLNLFEDAYRRESWEDFPLEFRLHAVDAIQFLEVVVLRIPFNFYSSKLRLGHPSRPYFVLSRRKQRLWQ